MAQVAVVGERTKVQGFALAGALVLAAEDPAEALAAWRSLGGDVAVVVLTPMAAAAVGDDLPAGRGLPLVAVLPP